MATFRCFCDDDGHVAMDDRSAFVRHARAKFLGREFLVITKPMPKLQGSQQLRYLRGVVIPDIAHACGYIDPDDYQAVYEGLMWRHFRIADGPFGEPRREHCSKDQMSMERLSQVIDTLITYAETSIPGCRVRRPDEVEMDKVSDSGWAA